MTQPFILAFENKQYTRSDLEAMACAIAGELLEKNVTRGTRIAVMSSNRPEFVAAVLAIWRLGASAVLLNPAWRSGEVSRALDVSGATTGVGDAEILEAAVPMVHFDRPFGTEGSTAAVPRHLDDEAVLVFSSGTTGMPKAVRHSHRSFGAAVEHWRGALDLTDRDRLQVVTPPAHILGLLNIITALDTGAWTRLEARFDVDRLLRRIESDGITIEMAVAPIALAIASHPGLEACDLSSLRYIMWGATPVTRSVAEKVTRRTGVRWVPAYGTSEVPVITCNPIEGGRLDSVGQPVPGVRLQVVDLDTGAALPTGEAGEILVRSPSSMLGYLPAAADQDAYVDGWYRTGDVGYIDSDGWVFLTDRSKEMIKTRGFQVAPAEVESVLHAHPAVADCAVFGVPDAALGERVVAAVTLNSTVQESELIAWIRRELATYKHPGGIEVIDEIPRLPSGKVLRRVLKESYGCTADK